MTEAVDMYIRWVVVRIEDLGVVGDIFVVVTFWLEVVLSGIDVGFTDVFWTVVGFTVVLEVDAFAVVLSGEVVNFTVVL